MSLKPSAQRVQDTLSGLGFDNQIFELADSTRTSAEAANAVGCEIGQIAKSLIFQGKQSGRPILIIASGANRVNVKAIKMQTGEALKRPNADFVREQTGYAIGGCACRRSATHSHRQHSSTRTCSNSRRSGQPPATPTHSSS